MKSLVLAVMAVTWMGGLAQAAPAPAPVPTQTLIMFDGANATFELAVDHCGEQTCPIRLRLVAAGKVLDSVAFGEKACGEMSPKRVDWMFGVASGTPAWDSSWRKCSVGVAAQGMRIAPNDVAVLVTQRHGWEHTIRQHWLFAARAGKLIVAWSSDAEGKYDLDVRVIDSPDGTTEDVTTTQVINDEDAPNGLPERIRIRRLHWDAGVGRIVALPMPDEDYPLFLAYVGPFKSVAAARDAADRRHPECNIPFGTLSASLFPGLGLHGFVRGEVFVSRAEADATKTEAGQCPAALTPKIIEYVPKVEYSRRTEK
jgi:hypothetical protein